MIYLVVDTSVDDLSVDDLSVDDLSVDDLSDECDIFHGATAILEEYSTEYSINILFPRDSVCEIEGTSRSGAGFRTGAQQSYPQHAQSSF